MGEIPLSPETYSFHQITPFVRELTLSSDNYVLHQRTIPFIRELPLSSENYPFHQRTTPFIRELHLSSEKYTFHQRTIPCIRELPLSSENYPLHQRTIPCIEVFKETMFRGESLNLEKLYVYFQKKLKQNKTHPKSIRFSLNNLHLHILGF